MKILIIKSVFVIALMLLITPLNAQSLKPLSKDKRDSTLISIAKKVLQKEAPEYLLEYGKPIISERKIHFKSKKAERNAALKQNAKERTILERIRTNNLVKT